MPDKPHLTDEQKERAIRKAVVESEEFMKWYEARRHIQPTPSDPYRAYMIDRSLRARFYDEFSWDDYVNRSDLVPVDNPQGTLPDGTPIQRKHRTLNFTPRSKVRPTHDKEKLYLDLQKYKADLIAHYGVPDADLVVERRSGAVYQRPIGGKGTVFIPENYYQAVKASKLVGHREQIFASTGHELGHHTQYAVGNPLDDDNLPPEGRLRDIFKEIKQPTSRLRSEEYAWSVAKDYKAAKGEKWRGMAKLREKFAFGSYKGTRPPALKGENPKAVFDFGTNLLLRPEQARSGLWRGGKGKIGVVGVSEINRIKGKSNKRSKRK